MPFWQRSSPEDEQRRLQAQRRCTPGPMTVFTPKKDSVQSLLCCDILCQ